MTTQTTIPRLLTREEIAGFPVFMENVCIKGVDQTFYTTLCAMALSYLDLKEKIENVAPIIKKFRDDLESKTTNGVGIFDLATIQASRHILGLVSKRKEMKRVTDAFEILSSVQKELEDKIND